MDSLSMISSSNRFGLFQYLFFLRSSYISKLRCLAVYLFYRPLLHLMSSDYIILLDSRNK